MSLFICFVLFPFLPLLIVTLTSTLVVGETQQGKTTLVVNEDAGPVIDSNECSVITLDPHGGFEDMIARHCAVKGHGHRLIRDCLGRTDYVASLGIIERSTAATPLRRRFENRRTAKSFAYTLAMKRKDFDERPNNRKYTILAAQAWLMNDMDLPLWYLPWALRPGTPYYQEILAGINDPDVRYAVWFLSTLPAVRVFETVGGADRLISEIFDEEVFKFRMVPTVDLFTALQKKAVICLSAGDADDDAVTAYFRLFHQRVNQIVKNHYANSGKKPLPVRIYVDEAANYKLYGMPESCALAQLTKMGKTDCIITQVPSFGDEEIDKNVTQNCGRKIILKSSPPVSEWAATMLKAKLDLMREHYREQTTKQRHAGTRTEERRSHKVDGDGISAGHVTNQASVPVYEDITEERVYYMALNDQKTMTEVEVEQLEFECFITNGRKVFKHKFADWEDPGIFEGDPENGIPSFSDDALREHEEWAIRQGILKPPTDVHSEQPLWNQPPGKPKAPAPPKSDAQARTKKARKGMGAS